MATLQAGDVGLVKYEYLTDDKVMKIKAVDTIERTPPPHWKFRAGTMDRSIWDTVCSGDEYRLAGIQFTPDDVVMDVGAHIGSFAWLAAQHGARHISCYEPVAENFELLRHNTRAFTSRCCQQALWGSHIVGGAQPSTNPANTGGFDVFGERIHGNYCLLDSFDDVLGGKDSPFCIPLPIRFLKLDCEGAEFPILLTSQRLDQIQQIALEYHERGPGTFYEHPIPEWAAIPGVPVWTGQVLAEHLERAGFVVEMVKGGEHLGMIYGTRR